MRLVRRPRLIHSMYFLSRTIEAYFPFAFSLNRLLLDLATTIFNR